MQERFSATQRGSPQRLSGLVPRPDRTRIDQPESVSYRRAEPLNCSSWVCSPVWVFACASCGDTHFVLWRHTNPARVIPSSYRIR